MNQRLLEATSPRLAELAAKLGRVGVRPERPIKHAPPLAKDGKSKGVQIVSTLEEIEGWFWSMIALIPETGCWEWQGRRDAHGYGRIKVEKREHPATRIVARLILGVYPNLYACHTCDNPPCCNPSHLFLGNDSDNARDSLEKGRRYMPCLKGSDSPRSKLTPEQVLEIRQRYSQGNCSFKTLAAHYGVEATAIRRIWIGKSWKCLNSTVNRILK